MRKYNVLYDCVLRWNNWLPESGPGRTVAAASWLSDPRLRSQLNLVVAASFSTQFRRAISVSQVRGRVGRHLEVLTQDCVQKGTRCQLRSSVKLWEKWSRVSGAGSLAPAGAFPSRPSIICRFRGITYRRTRQEPRSTQDVDPEYSEFTVRTIYSLRGPLTYDGFVGSSGHPGPTHWVFIVLHQSLLWASDRLD